MKNFKNSLSRIFFLNLLYLENLDKSKKNCISLEFRPILGSRIGILLILLLSQCKILFKKLFNSICRQRSNNFNVSCLLLYRYPLPTVSYRLIIDLIYKLLFLTSVIQIRISLKKTCRLYL